MPNKYQIIFRRDYSQSFTAHEKAPKDVVEILSRHGYEPIEINIRENLRSVLRAPYLLWTLLLAFSKLENKSEIFFQYPFTNYVNYFFWMFRFKGIKLKVLIHDLESLRYEGQLADSEIACLNHFDELIALTDAMKNLFIERGINEKKIKTLNIWDYLVKIKEASKQAFGYNVCFAGNLYKSSFVSKLHLINSSNLNFILYGSLSDDSNLFNEKIIYGGKFSPEDLSMLEGNWGLVWDGEDINTCKGPLGSYLRYNTSHKIGLYLAKEIPVIVWSQSAVAPYISENNLGLVVDSLLNLEDKITELGKDGYAEILNSVQLFSDKVRVGEMLGSLIA